jgi:hypothetical protein
MSETAVQEIAPGVKVDSGMTGAHILNAHLKAAGEKPVQPPHVSFAGPQGHPHTVVAGDAPPPPAPVAKPAPQTSTARIADFDAEMQSQGKQMRPDGRTIAAGEFDQEAADLITEHYKVLAAGAKDRPEVAARFKATYEADMKALYEGKQLTGPQIAKLRGKSGKVDTFLPKDKAQPATEHTPQQWAEAHVKVADKEGWIPLERINAAALSGYKLPKFLPDQTYHIGIFDDLANARRQGITQAQVDGFIRDGMVKAGWIKA